MIRVLHVVGGMNQGGVENFLMNVYRKIDRNKIQFDFLVNREGVFDEEIKSLGGNLYFIPALQHVGQIKYTENLDKFFKQHKEYKIVHSHINQVTGLILERANKANIPVRIAHSHGSQSSKNLIVKAYKDYLGKKILKNATLFFACSEMAAKWLFKEKSKDAIIINNGIEMEKFLYTEEKRNKIRKDLSIREDDTVIGNISRLSKVKNHMFLIDIFYEYQKKNPKSYLILVGDGKLRKKIENKVKKMKIEKNVKILGSRVDTDYLYSAFDYFVFPSLNEGLGIALIEAQVSGLKCFASDKVIPKTTKITENIEYLLLSKGSQYWAKHIYSKDKEKDRCNISIYEIKNSGYDIKDVVNKLQKIYEKCL